MFSENFKTIFFAFVGEQTNNHLENTEETLTLNVSRMFPRLRTQAKYLEEAESASRKQKCFASFPLYASMQHCKQQWLKMFLQQCDPSFGQKPY